MRLVIPVFAYPWAFWALLALLALAAIYWLWSRFRRHPVSSLMLWAEQRQIREGGLRFHRLQTPLLFFLELLALLLLVAAAAGPKVPAGESLRPLLVILDDSYSMRAGESESPGNRAIAGLTDELRRGRYDRVQLILAGQSPQVLGSVSMADQAIALLKEWQCRAPTSN